MATVSSTIPGFIGPIAAISQIELGALAAEAATAQLISRMASVSDMITIMLHAVGSWQDRFEFETVEHP